MRRWMMLSSLVFLSFALGVIPSGVQADTRRALFVSSSGPTGDLWRIDLPSTFPAPGSQTMIKSGLTTPEGLACGPDARVYIAESGFFQSGVLGSRKISRINQDGSDYTIVLDFDTTPELMKSGGPEGPNLMEDGPGTSGLMFFNTRPSGSFPHTGSWSATRTGHNVRNVLLPFTTGSQSAEGTDFLISGPFNRNFLAVDDEIAGNGRVLRAAPPFSKPQSGTVFITGLDSPNGLSINPLTGNVYVTEDSGDIKIFTDAGAPTGTPLSTLGNEPRKIDFDDDGNLYVATTNGPVLMYGPAGGTPTVIGSVSNGNGVAVCRTPDHKVGIRSSRAM